MVVMRIATDKLHYCHIISIQLIIIGSSNIIICSWLVITTRGNMSSSRRKDSDLAKRKWDYQMVRVNHWTITPIKHVFKIMLCSNVRFGIAYWSQSFGYMFSRSIDWYFTCPCFSLALSHVIVIRRVIFISLQKNRLYFN